MILKKKRGVTWYNYFFLAKIGSPNLATLATSTSTTTQLASNSTLACPGKKDLEDKKKRVENFFLQKSDSINNTREGGERLNFFLVQISVKKTLFPPPVNLAFQILLERGSPVARWLPPM